MKISSFPNLNLRIKSNNSFDSKNYKFVSNPINSDYFQKQVSFKGESPVNIEENGKLTSIDDYYENYGVVKGKSVEYKPTGIAEKSIKIDTIKASQDVTIHDAPIINEIYADGNISLLPYEVPDFWDNQADQVMGGYHDGNANINKIFGKGKLEVQGCKEINTIDVQDEVKISKGGNIGEIKAKNNIILDAEYIYGKRYAPVYTHYASGIINVEKMTYNEDKKKELSIQDNVNIKEIVSAKRQSCNPTSIITTPSKQLFIKNVLNMPKFLQINSPQPNYYQKGFLSFRVNKISDKEVNIISRYNNIIGKLKFNQNANELHVNIIGGPFQPIIEIEDKELGIKLLLNRGSYISGDDLNIFYKSLSTPDISFNGNLLVSEGYKAEKTHEIIKEYFFEEKFKAVQKGKYADKLKQDYTVVGLGGGYGTRLAPISELDGNNKPSTPYPGMKESLFEVSVLDTAIRSGAINPEKIKTELQNNSYPVLYTDTLKRDNWDYKNSSIRFIKDNPEKLLGTAGSLIKALKEGLIPDDKPLVLLTGDTFNNIDLSKALCDYEQNPDAGMMMILNPETRESMYDRAPIKIDSSGNIEQFFSKVNDKNYQQVLNDSKNVSSNKFNSDYLVGTNITIVHPKVLKIMKSFSDYTGKADFLEFLGFMYNLLNKPDESMISKYDSTFFDDRNREIKDLIASNGKPLSVYSDDGLKLNLKATVAEDVDGNKPMWSDVGTIEDFIKTINDIKTKDKIAGLNKNLIESIKQNTDSSGLMFVSPDAKEKLQNFKEKYHLKALNGNIIVHSTTPATFSQPHKQSTKIPNKDLYLITSNPAYAEKFIAELTGNPLKAKENTQNLIIRYGLNNFIEWYLNPKGYYGAYEKHIETLFNESGSIDELLKYAPNWAPWKLEEKYWLLNNPEYKDCSKEYRKKMFDSYCDDQREAPFTMGTLPEIFGNSKSGWEELIKTLKTNDIKEKNMHINGRYYDIKRLKGGELNNKFVYLVSSGSDKIILKFDRINVEDLTRVNGTYDDYRDLSLFEKKTVRKDKFLSADSVYSNACISRYLELNGCACIPEMLYYDHDSHCAAYEYVEDFSGDKFQQGLIDEEYIGINEMNPAYKQLNDLGIYLNDTAIKNVLIDKDGQDKVIDLGHSCFINPLKPGIKHYNIEFSNSNGPDLRTVYAGLMLSSLN